MAIDWRNVEGLEPKTYVCGHCGAFVGTNRGWMTTRAGNRIYICSSCSEPTYFGPRGQIPGVPYGGDVEFIPPESAAIYREARNCMTVSAYTAVVMLCRKLLMHVAVAEGAKEKDTFAGYVEHLVAAGYVPPKSRGWVDRIRLKANEANHEIPPIQRADAEELIALSEMVLKLVYEYPGRMPPPTT